MPSQRRSARRRRRASPRSPTRCRCSASTTPSPTRKWPSSSARVRRFLNLAADEPVALTAEHKIDGLSCSLRYEEGGWCSPRRAATARSARTSPPMSRTIADIPQRLAGAPDVFEVRGESTWRRRLRRAQRAAGSGGRQDLRQSAQCRGGLAAAEGRGGHRVAAAALPRPWLGRGRASCSARRSSRRCSAIAGWGLPVCDLSSAARRSTTALAHYAAIERARADLPYDIDGVVYKVDRLDWQERLG